ncbi:hypothetical protein KP509_20G029800 [Ceratopteris richardii]|uniref:Uncharacterized protein n=1 Tax=Ceratopteris richardii TaxID=49495 RepID=A0A8T2SHD9_CERRI|nr:hypothetical protein KP509_20G029800 [Ceratopteris richardii]
MIDFAAPRRRSMRQHSFSTLILLYLWLIATPRIAISIADLNHELHLEHEDVFGAPAELGFCTEATSRKTCPEPPTYDSIVIEKYLGIWYEIGSTATIKLQSEAGLACYQANYSLAAELLPSQGAKIALLHRGFPKLSAVSKQGVTRLSSAASSVCDNARHICRSVGPESPLRDALYGISHVVVEISPTHPQLASVLSQAIVNISSSLQNIDAGLGRLASNVTHIQIINGEVSQGLGTKQNNLESVNKLIRRAMSERSAITQLVSEVGIAREATIEVAKSLISDDSYAEVASKLLEAGQVIDRQTKAMTERLTNAELKLIAMAAASSSIMADKTEPETEWAIVEGQAVQNYSSPAKLVVSMQGFSGPYWIIGLEGSAEKGYEAALVYSCIHDQKYGEIHDTLFVLSRSTDLSRANIDRFLASAKLFGISTSCQNPFLLTLQDCESPWVE